MSALANGKALGGDTGNMLPFIQSAFADQGSDVTTTSTTWVDLLSVTLTTGANFLIIMASFSATTALAANNVMFRLLVDGVAKRGASTMDTVSFASSGAIHGRYVVSAGEHTIKLQWQASSALSAARVRPAANPESEHASLLVMEVRV